MSEGYIVVVCFFCSFDCEFDFLGIVGEIVFYKCVVNNDVKIMDILLFLGCVVDVRNFGGYFLLYVIVYYD